MDKKYRLGLVICSMLILSAPSIFALEKLSNTEMKSVTAQAGISIASDDVSFFVNWQAKTFRDKGTRNRFGDLLSPDGYVKFDLSSLMILNSNTIFDIGVFNESEMLTYNDQVREDTIERDFPHPLNSMAMVSISRKSRGFPEALFNLNNITVYDHGYGDERTLGDVNFTDIYFFFFFFRLFPPTGDAGCGIRGLGGTRLQISSLAYENPDQETGISMSNVMLGAAFTGDSLPETATSTNELDTSTWAFDEGRFQLGIPYYYHDDPETQDTELHTHPFSLDAATDENRPGDFQSYIAINAPVRGAIRIENISSNISGTSFDMGPIAIDGIRLYKNVVEFPGRGIGN